MRKIRVLTWKRGVVCTELVLIRHRCMHTGWSCDWIIGRRLTEGRGSPDLTPGRHHIQTSSAQSMWFHGGLAGWTGCGGTGSLDITETPNSHVYRHTLSHYSQGRDQYIPPTFKRKSVVAHSVTQILPHHIFYILQCLRLQWGVEARPLRTARQKNIIIAITSKKGPVQIALFVKPTVVGLWNLLALTVVSLPGRSWAHYHWESHHCLSPTLWRFESGLLHKVTSSRREANQRLLQQNDFRI